MATAPGPATGPGFSAPRGLRFSAGALRQVRRVTAQWAAWAGLPSNRADDFVIAVNEIATNAVRYGSPEARLLLRVAKGGVAEAEILDSGCWQPVAGEAGVAGPHGGMGLPLARLICDEVEIRAGHGGTAVTLRMSLQASHRSGGDSPRRQAGA